MSEPRDADLDAVLARLPHEKDCQIFCGIEIPEPCSCAVSAALFHLAAQAERLAEAEREREQLEGLLHEETPCPKREDGIHCVHWWDKGPCCGCGDDPSLIGIITRMKSDLAQARAASPADLRAAGHFLHTYRTSGGEICWQTKEAAAFGATDAEALEKLRPLCGLQPKLAAGGAKAKDG